MSKTPFEEHEPATTPGNWKGRGLFDADGYCKDHREQACPSCLVYDLRVTLGGLNGLYESYRVETEEHAKTKAALVEARAALAAEKARADAAVDAMASMSSEEAEWRIWAGMREAERDFARTDLAAAKERIAEWRSALTHCEEQLRAGRWATSDAFNHIAKAIESKEQP